MLKAAVLVSNPWNLDAGSLALQRTWIGKEVYSKTMTESLKKVFAMHTEQMSANPRLDLERIRQVTYLHEFDREVQCASCEHPLLLACSSWTDLHQGGTRPRARITGTPRP